MENFKISDYLKNLDQETSKGKCKGCGKMVSWSKERLAAHKRASCTAVCAEEKRIFAKRSSGCNLSRDEDEPMTNECRLKKIADKMNISDYLKDFDKETLKGKCKDCQKMVSWSRERLAAHKRASCTAASAEEKRIFAKRSSGGNLSRGDEDEPMTNECRQKKIVDKMNISDYLKEYDKETHRGKCKDCQKMVSWSRERLAAHKRASCTAASADEKRIFAKRSSGDNLSRGDEDEPLTTECPRNSIAKHLLDYKLDYKFENLETKCRLCLNSLKPGFGENTAELTDGVIRKIKDLVQFELPRHDCCSRFVCLPCCATLDGFLNFRNDLISRQNALNLFLRLVKEEPLEKSVIEITQLREDLKDSNVELPIDVSELRLSRIKTVAFDLLVEESIPTINNHADDILHLNSTSEQQYLKKVPSEWFNFTQSSFSASSMDDMSTHFPTFRGDDCDSMFSTVVKRLRHREVEHQDSLTETDERLQRRIERKKIAGSNRVPCDICGKLLSSETCQKHWEACLKKQKLEAFTFECDLCKLNFQQKADLRAHIKSIHLNLRSNDSHVKINDPFKCHCGKSFKSLDRLRRHKIIQHSKRYLKTCEHCGKVLKNGSTLKEHVRVFHTEGGQNNFMCKDCGKFFNFKGTLLDHEKHNHCEKTIPCQHEGCDKMFSKKNYRDSHYRSAHEVNKRFQCSDCGLAFTTRTRLTRHEAIKHEKRSNKCAVTTCSYRTGRKDNMRTHLKRHYELSVEESNRCMEALNHFNFV